MSKWSLNFSANPAPTWNGLDIGKNFAKIGFWDLASKKTGSNSVTTTPRSCHTTDIEFKFPFGWGELWGIADRTDFDLNAHSKVSGKNLDYTDPITNEKYVPYVIEPSLGVERMVLALLCNAYEEEELEGGDSRVVMHFHPAIAPYKVAVLPLQKKALGEKSEEIFRNLSKKFSATYDETASIGKRYRRQDEIGTPYCVTVDFDTLEDNCVTVRERDSMQQERVAIADLEEYLAKRMEY